MIKKNGTLMVLSLVMVLLLPSLPLIADEEDTTVSAAASSTADAAGYSWVNSKSPDPKLTFEWIDATGGTAVKSQFRYPYSYYDCYFYQGTPPIALPFAFPFYGDKYSQIYIWPNGGLTFQDTSNGYWYYANYAFPSTYYDYYEPALCIAGLVRYYGSVQISGTDANVYTLSGVNETGVKYWVCEWHNVQVYYPYNYGTGYYKIYSGDNKMTYETILYEDGNIRFNFLDVTTSRVDMYYGGGTSTTYTDLTTYGQCGTYGLCGIQDKTRTIGLTYAFNSYGAIKDGESVLIKQFKTSIDNVMI